MHRNGYAIVWGAAWTLLCATAAAQPAALPLEELPAPQSVRRGDDGSEVVRERHPDGRVAIERHVALDENQNYVNHGPWTSYDATGAKLVTGQYKHGKPHGMWTRWHRGHETALLQELPYNQFKPPFVSQATFRDGDLDGAWAIYDASQQKISEINFARGRRNGPAVWWYPNGGKMRELGFVDNDLEGEATFYRSNGQVARRERYERGRKVEKVTQKYPEGGIESEGLYRFPKIQMVSNDNWWQMELASFEIQGEGMKEGEWTVYFPNGQKRLVGVFQNDLPVGRFTWWHETGQRALAGQYDQDGAKRGEWTWWHPNGMRMSHGSFRLDSPRGMWASWDNEGNLLRRIESFEAAGDRESLVSAPADEPEVEELAPPSGPAESAGTIEELPAGNITPDPPSLIRRPPSPYSPLPELLHGNN